jgi:hypothetical protein
MAEGEDEVTETGAEAVRKDRPPSASKRPIGRPFLPKNPGKPKGTKDRRRIAGQATSKALEAKAWDVVEALLTCRSWRARFESAKVVLSYSIGLPRQSIDISGGAFSEIAVTLAVALRAAREARATAALQKVEPAALEEPVIDAVAIESTPPPSPDEVV